MGSDSLRDRGYYFRELQGRRQLSYAHCITMIILRARPVPLPAHLQRELSDSDIAQADAESAL